MIFNNKTVVITGGSEGVGAAAARLFAEAGANLMLVARDKKKLDILAKELREKTSVKVFPMDVTDKDACSDLFKKAQFEFERIDVLVNNAGYHKRGNFETVAADDLEAIIDVNLTAPIRLTRLCLPYLRDAGGGVIVNVGSLAGRTPVPGSAGYAASKAGLRSLTFSLSEELRGSGIKVALVSPGPIDTGFIMSDIDDVSDITMSQPISSAERVAQSILDICGNNVREETMPAVSAILTTFTYLFPSLRRFARPYLEKKGAKVKAKIKAEQKRRASSSPES